MVDRQADELSSNFMQGTAPKRGVFQVMPEMESQTINHNQFYLQYKWIIKDWRSLDC